jgi:DNA-binding NtrC family response regulator
MLPIRQFVRHNGMLVALGLSCPMLALGESPMQMLELVARVGPSNASVLLLGESGTGNA